MIESQRIGEDLDKQARRDREYRPVEYSASVMATKAEIEAERKRKAPLPPIMLPPLIPVPLGVLQEIRDWAEEAVIVTGKGLPTDASECAGKIVKLVNAAIRGNK